MMFGTCNIVNGSIVTSKTTYVVTLETRPDVRRIFAGPSGVIAGGLTLFGIGFSDLLFWHETGLIAAAVIALTAVGSQLARLTILDRVTRGTEQMSAIYGLHSVLQEKRREINAVIDGLSDSNTRNPNLSSIEERS
ncbi:MAG: hypothetical protein AAF478_11220 [Pseudomonadota bacterium]